MSKLYLKLDLNLDILVASDSFDLMETGKSGEKGKDM